MKAVEPPRRAARASASASSWPQNVPRNLAQWGRVLVRAPRAKLPPPSAAAIVAVAFLLIATVAAMFLIDATASAWARGLPRWFVDVFEEITNFGLSGWFLFPFDSFCSLSRP